MLHGPQALIARSTSQPLRPGRTPRAFPNAASRVPSSGQPDPGAGSSVLTRPGRPAHPTHSGLLVVSSALPTKDSEHTHTRAYTQAHMHTLSHAHTCSHARTRSHTCSHVHKHVHTHAPCTRLHSHAHTPADTHAHMLTHTCTCLYTLTHAHALTHTNMLTRTHILHTCALWSDYLTLPWERPASGVSEHARG